MPKCCTNTSPVPILPLLFNICISQHACQYPQEAITLHNVCAVHRGVCSTMGMFSTLGDIMSTVGGVQYTRGCHDKCGGRSLRKQLNLYGNPSVLNIPWCTRDIPPHSLWYPPSVLMVSPDVLNTPTVLIITPTLIMVSPHCTEHPQFYAKLPTDCFIFRTWRDL